MTYYNCEDYSEYEEEYGDLGRGGFQKTSKTKKMKKEDKPKKDKHTRNISSEEFWTMMENRSSEADFSVKRTEKETHTPSTNTPKKRPTERKENTSQSPQGEKKFVPGPNTHTIRNYQIDFDRVFNITKVEGEYNGKKSFGVKFEFKGTKGLFRVVWFHSEKDRDILYNEKYAFWASLETCPLNRKKEGVKNDRY